MASNVLEAAFKGTQLKSDVHADWCPGCGDFGITNAVQMALAELKLPPWNTALVSGVGCSGKTPHYVQVYGIHTLHGRSLAFASGIKMANPRLNVVVVGGDGDGYGIGAGHFVHAGRRNLDMAYVVFNNEVYGLTKGQASPTLAQGAQPKSLPLPNPLQGINPLALAIACGYTFVARSYAYDSKHLKATIMAAIEHKGMALVDVLQPCPTYNNLHTKEYYAEEVQVNGYAVPRVYYLEDKGYDGRVKNPNDLDEVGAKRAQALARAYEVEEQVPLGIYWQIERPTFHETISRHIPLLQQHDPQNMPYHDAKMTPTTNLMDGLQDFVI